MPYLLRTPLSLASFKSWLSDYLPLTSWLLSTKFIPSLLQNSILKTCFPHSYRTGALPHSTDELLETLPEILPSVKVTYPLVSMWSIRCKCAFPSPGSFSLRNVRASGKSLYSTSAFNSSNLTLNNNFHLLETLFFTFDDPPGFELSLPQTEPSLLSLLDMGYSSIVLSLLLPDLFLSIPSTITVHLFTWLPNQYPWPGICPNLNTSVSNWVEDIWACLSWSI